MRCEATRTDTHSSESDSSVFRLLRQTGSMFVTGFLFLSLILIVNTRLVAISQSIESFDTATLVDPFLLSRCGLMLRLDYRHFCLLDCLVQFRKEACVVLPLARTQAILRGAYKARPVFFPIAHQQNMSPRGFLFTRDEFAQLAPGFIETQLRKVEQGLEGESAVHGGRRIEQTRSYAAPNNSARR